MSTSRSVYVTDGQLRAEGIKALTLTQAQQLITHNLNKISYLLEQNKHLQAHIDKLKSHHAHEEVAAAAPVPIPSARVPDIDRLSVASIASSEPLEAPVSARTVHEAAHDMGRQTRLLNRLEAAFKRFHHKSPIEEWEGLSVADLEAAVVKAECIAEIIELEHLRRVGHPTTAPYFTEPPKMSDPDAAVAELDAKVRALGTLYRLVENPKISRLRLQAYGLDVTRDAVLLEECVRKAQLLRDVKSHLKDLRLVGTEDELDLTSPLEAIERLHNATSADHRMLKSFTKCPMCKCRHAPQYVLDRHPHLKLKPTGVTFRGGKQCCVSCAPYWD